MTLQKKIVLNLWLTFGLTEFHQMPRLNFQQMEFHQMKIFKPAQHNGLVWKKLMDSIPEYDLYYFPFFANQGKLIIWN